MSDISYWVVWDKSGTKYAFGDPSTTAGKQYFMSNSKGDRARASEEIIKWGLVSVQSIFVTTITYS
jgi:hypothetical protein